MEFFITLSVQNTANSILHFVQYGKSFNFCSDKLYIAYFELYIAYFDRMNNKCEDAFLL